MGFHRVAEEKDRIECSIWEGGRRKEEGGNRERERALTTYVMVCMYKYKNKQGHEAAKGVGNSLANTAWFSIPAVLIQLARESEKW